MSVTFIAEKTLASNKGAASRQINRHNSAGLSNRSTYGRDDHFESRAYIARIMVLECKSNVKSIKFDL